MKFSISSRTSKGLWTGSLGLGFFLATASVSQQARAQEEESSTEAESPEESTSDDQSIASDEESDVDAEASFGADASMDASGTDGDVEVSEGSGLFASATVDEEAGGESDGGVTLDWGGYVRGDMYIGIIPDTTEPAINAAYGELAFQPRITAGKWGAAFADARLRYGQQLSEYGLQIDLREAYASAYLGPVELRVGKQIVVWGRADAFNPTSNIAPVDFRIRSPIEDDRRLGTVGARGFLTFAPFKLEGVWMPLYEPTIYPEIQLDPLVVVGSPYYPTTSLRNGLIAGRLHLELPAVDASVSYLYGYAPLPGIELQSYTVGPAAQVVVQRRAYRQYVLGADFSTTPGNLFGLRGEAAYRHPFNYQVSEWAARPDVQWVLGVDKEFGPVMIIAQYMGRYTIDWEPERYIPGGTGGIYSLDPTNPNDVARALPDINDSIFNSNRMIFSQLFKFQNLVSGRIEWKTLHDTLSISALAMYNLTTNEWLVSPKIGYEIGSGVTTYVGADIIRGPEGTLFNVIEDQLTAGYAELRVSY